MSWDTDFYQAAKTDTDFTSGINDFFLEYKSGAVAPYAAYQLINGSGTQSLKGVGLEGERRIQLTVWASSPTQAKQLAEHARNGVQNTLEVNELFERSLGRDPDEQLFGYAIDFTIWFQNP